MNSNCLIITGTRPEIIKMAPVYLEMKKEEVSLFWCHTGQHDELADQTFKAFDIQPDFVFSRPAGDGIATLVSGLLQTLEALFIQHRFDCVIVHGDTTSTLSGALAAFYNRVPLIAHVEAGLRSGDLTQPFPEESNRLLVARIANIHFPPTIRAYEALISENIPKNQIFITGNTAVDSQRALIESGFLKVKSSNKILITSHRRENWKYIDNICEAIILLTVLNPELEFVFSVHPNPKISNVVLEKLGGIPSVLICEALSYLELQLLLSEVKLVLTDSGGIQEEAPTYGKRVVVLRDTTERPEALQLGYSILTGANDPVRIVDGVLAMLSLDHFAGKENPFGDGYASHRIVKEIMNKLRC